MRRFLLVVVGLAAGAILALPGTASASHDPSGAPFDEDFVTGGTVFAFNAHSGPSGENPRGTVIVAPDLIGQVTCLAVTGNRATVGVDFRPQISVTVVLFVEDNAATGSPDRRAILVGGEPPLTVCPTTPPPGVDLAPVDEDFVVHDAVPFPTSKDQCKKGGWRSFPGFKNQGQCVAFVQRGPKP